MRRVSSRAGNLEAKPVEESPHAWDGAAGSCDSFRVPIQGAPRDECGWKPFRMGLALLKMYSSRARMIADDIAIGVPKKTLRSSRSLAFAYLTTEIVSNEQA